MSDKGDVWNPSKDVVENVRKEVDEVVRVLKPGGKFLYNFWTIALSNKAPRKGVLVRRD